MNQLFKEYPKKVVVACYCPIGKWNVRSVANGELCRTCRYYQEQFDIQYRGLAAKSEVGIT